MAGQEAKAAAHPAFFDQVPRLKLRDPLAQFLGAADQGEIDYGYLDAVKLAGHSCPTVAAAYWLTHRALGALYPDALPERGAIRVDFRDNRLNGVTGVIANVVSLLTGATSDTGFKGLAGQFDRRNLLYFNAAVPLDIRFTRTDSGRQVDVAARPGQVSGDPEMPGLMQRCLSGQGDTASLRRFGELWQDRVRRLLLDHGADPEVFLVRLTN
jgi:hypothetical protein